MADGQRFDNRTEAGQRLAGELRDRGIAADIVLAIPRGGLPLGRAVADAFDAPLDVAVAKKIGAPGNPEYALGAVATDGSVWRNEEAFGRIPADEEYFQEERERMAEAARAKAERYRGDRPAPDLTGKTVLLVDDGVATGSTAMACLEMIRSADPERVILAVPVGPPETIAALRERADDVVCLEIPRNFRGVGQFYREFEQVSDEEAMTYLDGDE